MPQHKSCKLLYLENLWRRLQVLTNSVRFGRLNVHVARLFNRLHHKFLGAGEDPLNIQVSEAKQLGEASTKHEG